MNQSKLSRFLLPVFLAVLLAAPALHAQEEAQVIPLTSLELIKRPSGWTITVTAAGSGSISYGSSAGDSAFFPKGTVDFEKLVAAFKRSKKVEASDPSCVQVIANTAKRPSTMVAEPKELAAEWEAICVQITKNLQATDPERIELLLEHTPLGKEKPAEKIKVQKINPRSLDLRPPGPKKPE